MKTKLKLNELRVSSFITKEESHKMKGGVTAQSDCANCSTGCTGSGGLLSRENCAM